MGCASRGAEKKFTLEAIIKVCEKILNIFTVASNLISASLMRCE